MGTFQKLSQQAGKNTPLSELAEIWATHIVRGAGFRSAGMLAVNTHNGTLSSIAWAGKKVFGDSGETAPTDLLAWIRHQGSDLCNDAKDDSRGRLGRFIGLDRFLWSTILHSAHGYHLVVAGYDEEVAAFYTPFNIQDLAYFTTVAVHFEAIVNNARLLSELSKEKENLEQGVKSRTRELEKSNRQLSETMKQMKIKDQELRQSQKIEAIGALAGGVAHDINNVLAGIMGLTSLMVEDLNEGDPWRMEAEDILTACKRGRELTRNLLGFARKGKYRKEIFSVNSLVDELKDLLKHTIPKTIRVETNLETQLLGVEGDPNQISHLLMNVGLNGIEAMEGKGVLTVSTSNVVLDARGLTPFHDAVPGPYVRIQIADNGMGIVKENIDRVFEPFFTTKPEGQGTGLGLSMVYGTINNHGGTVSLDSTIDQGTTVTMHLPAVEINHELPPPKKQSKSLTSGTGTVLLVDDERLVRDSGKRMLKKLGFDVVVAIDGHQAIAACEERRGDLTIVILDIIMPVMDGTETFYAIKQAYPNLEVLLSSGYTKEDKADNLLRAGAIGFIQKPYTFETLSRELAKVL